MLKQKQALMSIWQRDRFLASQYQFEFEKLLYYYMPYTARFFCNIYVPNFVSNSISNNNLNPNPDYSVLKNIGLTPLDDSNYATERPFDQTETGITYTLIQNMPVYLADASQLAETQLKITDSLVAFMQQSTLIMRAYNVIPTFVGAVIQLYNPYMSESRLFEITGQSKFSAFEYNVNDTIYKLSVALLNKHWNPYISNTLIYIESQDTIVTIPQYIFLNNSLSYYAYATNAVRQLNYPIKYIGLCYQPAYDAYYILDDFIPLSSTIYFQQYKPVSYTDAIIYPNYSLSSVFLNSDTVINLSLTANDLTYNLILLDSASNFIVYALNSYSLTNISVTAHSLSYYIQNGYTYPSLTTTFNDAFDFWYQYLVSAYVLSSWSVLSQTVNYASQSLIFYGDTSSYTL